jgi:SAM-dependent methyltransferase
MLYRSKLNWIAGYVANAEVLDLGCVCHELDISDPPWLHGFLVERASRVVGVDILPDAVAELERRGYEVVCANVETMDLDQTFDVVVAGDIIEHLSNLGLFFERVRAHLADGGLLLVATPNPLNPMRMLRLLTGGRDLANGEHTCWFTQKVLRQLAARHGFEVADESYADDTRYYYRIWPSITPTGGALRRGWRRTRTLIKRLWWRPWIWLTSLLCLVRPRFSETLCMAFRVKEDESA